FGPRPWLGLRAHRSTPLAPPSSQQGTEVEMYDNAEQPAPAPVSEIAECLYREHYRYLLGIARRNSADADAEEALQFAFQAFLEHYDRDGAPPPLAWLILTLKRECWAKGRRHPRQVDVQREVACDTPSPEESIERSEALVEARQALALLKPA